MDQLSWFITWQDSCQALTNSLLHLERKRLRRAIALMTGHGSFRKHLQTVGLFQGDPICRLCKQDIETAKHILFECEVLERGHLILGTLALDGIENSLIGMKVLELTKNTELELL